MTELRVHVVPGAVLQRYQVKRNLNLRIVAPQVRLDRWLVANGVEKIESHDKRGKWVAFHSWRPTFLDLDDTEGPVMRELRSGRSLDSDVGSHLLKRLDELCWTRDEAVDLRAVTIRALVDFAALQNPWELHQVLQRIAALQPRTILEIGTSGGGLLYALAQIAAPDATLISIDVPDRHEPQELITTVTDLLPSVARFGQQLHMIREPSTYASVRDDVRKILADRPLDLLLIDGDHSYGGARSDFEMYSGLVGAGGIIAFHDVAIDPSNSPRGFDVGLYWPELERAYRTETIIDPEGIPGVTAQNGVAQRDRKPMAFGFGLVLR